MGHEYQKSLQKIQIFLLLLNIQSFVVQGFALRDCRISLNVSICDSGNLAQVPTDIPPTVRGIDLTGNKISKIQVTNFINFPNVTELKLGNNQISSIEKGAFSHLISLRKLVLNRNKLTTLVNGVFDGLGNLTELLITYNHITIIEPNAFRPLRKLKVLNFSGNKVSTTEQLSLIIKHTPHLNDLTIRSIRMSSFRSSEFANKSTELRLLDISDNPLKFFQITTNAFPNLTWLNIGNPPQKLIMLWDIPDKAMVARVDTLDISRLQVNSSQKMWDLLSTFNTSLTSLRVDSARCNLATLINKSCSIPTVSTLQLRQNNLPHIRSRLFSSCSNITEIDLSICGIKGIANDSFMPLSRLEILRLFRNKLTEVPQAIRTILSLKELDLRNNSIENLGCYDFANLVYLKQLSLQWNKITSLQKCVFQNLPRLQVLELHRNFLAKLNNAFQTSLPSLKVLRLFNNSLATIKKEEFRGLPALENLTLAQNNIHILEKGCFSGLKSLLNLQLDENDIRSDTLDGCFKGLVNLRKLSIGKNRITYTTSSPLKNPPFLYLSSLENLDFRSQHIRGKGALPSNLLEGLTNLTALDFDNINIVDIPENFFNYTPKLDSLDLSANDLMDFSPYVFAPIRNLTKLRVTSTNLRALDFLINAKLKKLDFLQARKNAFSVITEDIIKAIPSIRYVDFQYNSFTCNCDSMDFINWILTNNHTQVFDAYNFKCYYPPQKKNTKLLDLNVQSCIVDYAFICFVSTTCFNLVFMIIVFIYHFMRFQIAYAYYLLLAWLLNTKHKNRKAPNQYDAFVSYNVHDEAWVYRELVPHLENDQGWKLCLHHRDFAPGRPIVENITDAIYGSRKTLCVISRRYLQSEWCSKEMQVASFRLFDERKDVLILVFLEDIPSAHLTPYHRMRRVLKSQTYLSWPGTGPETQLFWEKLRKALTCTESKAADRLLLTVTDEE
ncbi:toll-like receptor 13 [Boleophthalmus pectinirostris]|uniref:toll-like receptor 13 n=1 Tax=Boleophthalmus pectinirostris TaxID=150288 RepID=UPI002432537D|nr:toll-like receptor 13 [Boleophthalmus pectinirostris]